MKNTFTLYLLLIIAFSHAQNTVTDIDGNTYKTVVIGQQEWMAEELRVSQYNDGTPISEYKIFNESEWESYKAYVDWQIKSNIKEQPYYRIEGQTYSYNERAINSDKELCPKGWRVPTKEDWDILIDFLGGHEVAGGKLRSHTGWPEGSNGNNKSGFDGKPLQVDAFKDFCPQPNAVWWCASGCKVTYLCSEKGYGEEKEDVNRIFTSFYGDGSMFENACIRCIKE